MHVIMRACVHVYVISEIKHSFQSFRHLYNYIAYINPSVSKIYVMREYFLFVYAQLTLRHVERPIA